MIDKSEGDDALLTSKIRQQYKVLIISDGSYHPTFQLGTAAWVITTIHTLYSLVYRDNIIPGDSVIQYSHRSEISGIIRVVCHLKRICMKFNLQNVSVELRCDGMEALRGTETYHHNQSTNIRYFDLLSTLDRLINESPIQIIFNHVNGHRDRTSTRLTLWEELNVIADIRTKVALWELISEERTMPIRQTHPLTLNPILLQSFNRSLQISSNLKAQLYYCLINRDIV